MNSDLNIHVSNAFRGLYAMKNRTIKRINAIERLEAVIADAQAALAVVRANVPLLDLPASNIERAQREADRIIATATEQIAERRAVAVRKKRNPNGAPVTRWQAWVGDSVALAIDGVEVAGVIASMSRGPVMRVALADGRTVALRVVAQAPRPKRKPRGRGVIAPPAP